MRGQGWLVLAALILAGLACNFPVGSAAPVVTPTMPGETRTAPPAATHTPAPAISFTATATSINWPPPHFGSPGPTPVTAVPSPMPLLSNPDSVTFLLIGSDRRTSTVRTDTLILANYQPEYRMVTLISVPRDLYVYIPGWTMQRINAAYQHGVGNAGLYPEGGLQLLKDTIRYNLGIEVDYAALVGFDGFINIVDALGGVDVPVACAYTDWHILDPQGDAEDEDNWALYTVGPGLVYMDGDLALWYARSRLKSSDFDRGRRQQELLRALFGQALQFNTLGRLPDLYREFRGAVETDIGLEDLLPLSQAAPGVGLAQIRSVYINGDVVQGWRTPQNAAVLIPNQAKLYALLQRALGVPDAEEQAHTAAYVEVWNASGQPDWGELAVTRLQYGGFAAGAGNNERGQVSRSVIEVLSETVNIEEAQALAGLLGLRAEALVHVPAPGYASGYRLVLGADYNPCFNPAKIDR